jgi:hypothetical protein
LSEPKTEGEVAAIEIIEVPIDELEYSVLESAAEATVGAYAPRSFASLTLPG